MAEVKKPAGRYKQLSDVKSGDVVLFDNKNGFVKELPSRSMIGEVKGTSGETDVEVDFKISADETKLLNVHFLLLQ